MNSYLHIGIANNPAVVRTRRNAELRATVKTETADSMLAWGYAMAASLMTVGAVFAILNWF